jgi:leucyl/phenylalanyl-tRNA---protein transferase
VHYLRPGGPLVFPPPSQAGPEGLLAIGGDLSPERLLLAYRSGIFPWFNEDDPILWWSPDPRCVLYVEELHTARSMKRVLGSARFRISLNTAFLAVVEACRRTPRPGQDGTWITRSMVAAYAALREGGHAHSVEVWQGDELAGGIFGVASGRLFVGESMFHRRDNASKVALIALVGHLRSLGYRLMDCQMATSHLLSLGAREIPREQYLEETGSWAGSAQTPPQACWVPGELNPLPG